MGLPITRDVSIYPKTEAYWYHHEPRHLFWLVSFLILLFGFDFETKAWFILIVWRFWSAESVFTRVDWLNGPPLTSCVANHPRSIRIYANWHLTYNYVILFYRFPLRSWTVLGGTHEQDSRFKRWGGGVGLILGRNSRSRLSVCHLSAK